MPPTSFQYSSIWTGWISHFQSFSIPIHMREGAGTPISIHGSLQHRRWRKAYKILPGKGNQSSEYVPPHSLYHIRHLCSGACCPKWWATGHKCCCRLELVGDVRFQVCWKCRIQVFLNQNLHFNWILILKSKKHCSFIIRIQWNTTDLMV